MPSRHVLRSAVCLGVLGVVGTAHTSAQTGQPPGTRPHAQRSQSAAEKPGTKEAASPAQSEDERAIRALDEAFVREYNSGDSKALAAHFTEDAEVVEANDDRYEGRAVIERSFADTFAAAKGAKIAFEIDSIRLLSPDAAKEEGRSLVTPPQGAPVARRYTVLYVKRGGQWLIAGVREEADPFSRPHDRLKDLEWLVGDWIDEGSDAVVRVHCGWSEDANFLIRTFTVKRQGKPVLSVTQRIGWDPLAKQVRSWEFDSEGGFGEGAWSRHDGRWVVKYKGVRPEGTTASATHTMSRERPDLVRWVATDRVVGDESLADDASYLLVRIPPPPPGSRPEPAPASTTNPATTRSPR
ncbi:MAG: SgcJ/EcaC family oxidoreductase [Isosphaeraceae bacterium]|nr:SgcJ/EcaC family oxidoreductase [Isosphaeraceae bacterium]